MVSKVRSMGLYGMDAFLVEIEADLSTGLPSFDVVGLPDASVKESRDRIRASFKNTGFDFPVARITVNMAPADKRKEGSLYDLPLFVALLIASGQLSAPDTGFVFLGELSLSGEVRLCGCSPDGDQSAEDGFQGVFVPAANAQEAAVVDGIRVYPVRHVKELFEHLTGTRAIAPASPLERSGSSPFSPARLFRSARSGGSQTRP